MLPYPVIQRLPHYLSHVMELKDDGVAWVSSGMLAHALGLTTSTVRQDLSHLDLTGVSRRGYRRSQLEQALRAELEVDRTHRAVLVGAGYLGTALALHGDLKRYGFEICAVFDNDPEVVGTALGGLTVRSMKTFTRTAPRLKASIAILAVPRAAAQAVADQAVAAGFRGILNLAYCVLRVPDQVAVSDVRMLEKLQELPCLMRLRAVSATRRNRGATAAA